MGLIRNAILALAAVLAATSAHAQIAFRGAAQAGVAAGSGGSTAFIAATQSAGGSSGVALAKAVSPAVYLLGRWNDALDPDANAATAYDDKPPGQAGFGLYGSQPKSFVFFRENF